MYPVSTSSGWKELRGRGRCVSTVWNVQAARAVQRKGAGWGTPPCQLRAAGQSHCSLVSMAGCREPETSPWFRQSWPLLQGGCSGCLCKARQQPTRSSPLKTAVVPPTHTIHLPRADRCGNSLLMQAAVWVPGLRSPAAPQSVLALTQPWGCSVWLPVVLKHRAKAWRSLKQASLSPRKPLTVAVGHAEFFCFPGKTSPGCSPKAIWTFLWGPLREISQWFRFSGCGSALKWMVVKDKGSAETNGSRGWD